MTSFDFACAELKTLQDTICHELESASSQIFHEDAWNYEHGSGGGRTRIVENGDIEKGGVNFSGIGGVLNATMAEKLKQPPGTRYKATGVSLVIHPSNPYVPTVHANVRYFETADTWWIGGGVDLTPYYFFRDDVVHFHSTLKSTCDRYDKTYYPKFKKQCDDYFFIKHRNETRGVGGIFFDHLKTSKHVDLSFVQSVGNAFSDAYIPIFNKRKALPFTETEREFQLIRRGRYVEFNLVYDRGTQFGFQTNGRTESILMSLPATAKWVYNYQPDKGSKEYEIYNYLKPVDWLGIDKN